MNTASLAATWWFLTLPVLPTPFLTEAGGFSAEGPGFAGVPWIRGSASSDCLTGRGGPVWETDTTVRGHRQDVQGVTY